MGLDTGLRLSRGAEKCRPPPSAAPWCFFPSRMESDRAMPLEMEGVKLDFRPHQASGDRPAAFALDDCIRVEFDDSPNSV